MSEQPEARIILKRGRRLDLKAELSAYDPRSGREEFYGLCGPGQDDIDRKVMELRAIFDKARIRTTFKEVR